jgi:hypothetical protein
MNHATLPIIPNLSKEEIVTNLRFIQSRKPFIVLFYGSRQRGDFKLESDYNFYLLASSVDQMQKSFLDEVSQAIQGDQKSSHVHLIVGDIDSFQDRMELREPCATHLMELGEPLSGQPEFLRLKTIWEKIKETPIPRNKLMQYLEKRIQFYQRLKHENPREELSRMEKMILLSIQAVVVHGTEDLSVGELTTLDIPDRILPLCKALYQGIGVELDDTLLMLEEVREMKTKLRILPLEETDELLENDIKNTLMEKDQTLFRKR